MSFNPAYPRLIEVIVLVRNKDHNAAFDKNRV